VGEQKEGERERGGHKVLNVVTPLTQLPKSPFDIENFRI